jgi:hypothetical protein
VKANNVVENEASDMASKMVLGTILMMLSLIPLGFLVYSLLNLDRLGITLIHPRVLVELFIFLVLSLVGIVLRHRKLV